MMTELDILFPIPDGNRNADDMGVPPATGWRCPDCCGTGFHSFLPLCEEKCATCDGTGVEIMKPNV